MRVLDLFSGIGGFSLGLERAGYETIAFCEIEPFCQKVLGKWWPSTPIFKDILKLNDYFARALMSSAEDSPAKTFPRPEEELVFPVNAVDSGEKCYEPFAWYDRSTSSWKTWQRCLVEGWEPYSGTWPRAGMMRNGIAYQLVPLAPITSEIVSGSLPTIMRGHTCMSGGPSGHRKKWAKMLPTLTICGNYNKKGSSPMSGDGLATVLKKLFPEDTASINPSWAEGYMGYPIGWTELRDSEIPLFPKSPKLLAKQSKNAKP